MAPVRQYASAEDRNQARARRQREGRVLAQHNISQIRELNASQHRLARQALTEEEANLQRERHSSQQQRARQGMTHKEAELQRERNASQQQRARQAMTHEEAHLQRERNASQQHRARQGMTREEAVFQRERHASQQRLATQTMPVEEAQQVRNNHAARQRSSTARRCTRTNKIALQNHAEIQEIAITQFYCGKLDVVCTSCSSLNFKFEEPRDRKFSACCHKGKVKLPQIPYPDQLKSLLTREHPNSSNFLNNIRKFNNAFAFASMGAQIKSPPGTGPYCFRIQGQVYHSSGPLHPPIGQPRKFAQIYILDPDEALDQRMSILANNGCSSELMRDLDVLIRGINPYAEAHKMLYEVEQEEEKNAKQQGRQIQNISMAIVNDAQKDPRRYNAARSNEIAFVFKSSDGAPPFDRDICVHLRDANKTKNVSILNCNVDPMTYPLLFPYGYEGWKDGIAYSNGANGNVTQLQFYAYLLAVRDEFSPILNAGKLTQQFSVDAYCKIEACRLKFIEFNQKKLRVENYNTLQQHLMNQANNKGLKPGKQVVLPSSFEGSDRAMRQHYDDAMAIAGKYGCPDLFITMTCNPKWSEITENLKQWQTVEGRPDLVARVFRMKLKELLTDITEKHIFGLPVARIHVIEFQKRGLPHAHILIILRAEDKPRNRDQIDQIVSAELPSQDLHSKLHSFVMQNMIHGPCGKLNPCSPCMVDGKCSKKFPKKFTTETNPKVDGYPLYRRRDTRKAYIKGKYSIDNSWVVPYNPYLLLKYNCHINVEIVASISCLKYLFKYIYKGHDCANVEIRHVDGSGVLTHDEVKFFLDSRYISPPESLWRIFQFKMHEQSHAIQRLTLNLPGEQSVFFNDGAEDNALFDEERDNTLTAWFKLNSVQPEARQYYYREIPEYFTYHRKEREWKTRKSRFGTIIGRIYNVSPQQRELYFLRLLLLHVKGPTSFEDIRTVNEVTFDTFKEAAGALNLLADDSEWERSIQEAVRERMPAQVRQLLAFICVFCEPKNPILLWEQHKPDFTEDYIHLGIPALYAEYRALIDIQNTLALHGKRCSDYGLPEPPSDFVAPANVIDLAVEEEEGSRLLQMLYPAQRVAFNQIMEAIANSDSHDRLFYLDGPGGSGKTFTYETLYHNITALSLTVTCCASTGIAGTLLPFGRTYHSTFKLPVPLLENSTSNIRANSEAGKLLKNTSIIIWDEVTMTPFHALDAVDKLLRDLMQDERPFGGKVIVLGGDFRQCLPVVPHGNRVNIVQACLKSGRLWSKFICLQLNENMRVEGGNRTFQDWLIQLGDGRITNDYGFGEDIIEIPEDFVENECLIDSIFGKTISATEIHEFSSRAILCPKNEDVHRLNDKILDRLQGEMKTYYSVDSILTDEPSEVRNYPIEFLNTITPSGMPPHKLNLKIGAIVILLRNLATNKGLCNGTRLVIRLMNDNLLIAEILTGRVKGQVVFIPRMDLIPSDNFMPFKLRRRQFPVMLAFAMTINKSQGQSLDSVGIYLPDPVFSHGQLYVAFSRCRYKEKIKVKILDTDSQGKLLKGSSKVFTKNVVYREVLNIQNNNTENTHCEIMEVDPPNKEQPIPCAEMDVEMPEDHTPRHYDAITQDPPFSLEFEPDNDEMMSWYSKYSILDIHGNIRTETTHQALSLYPVLFRLGELSVDRPGVTPGPFEG